MRKNSNQLRSGVVLSYLNLTIRFIIPFFYTPLVLNILGQNEYGLYSLSSSVISYLSLLSFGFGSTILRYVAKYRAEKDNTSIENSFGFFLVIYGLMAIVAFAIGMVLSSNVNAIFERGLQSAEQSKMVILLRIMSFNCALSFPISVFSSMILAHERYVYRRLLDIVSTIVSPVINLVALYMGFESIGLALSSTILQVILLPIDVSYCFHVLRIRPRFSGIPKSVLKEMLGFSLFVFIGTVVDMLFWATDKVILGMLASTAAVAVYNIGSTFNDIVMTLSTSISGVLTPRIVGMVTTNQPKENLTELTIRIGRLQFIIVALVVSGFAVFGQTFISLWAGNEYLDAYWVAVLTLFPLCIPLVQSTAKSIITAQNRHRFRAIVYLLIAIINVITTYLIVPYMGIIGAALCTCVSYITGQGIIMNIYYHKVIGINIPLFWKNILSMAVVPGAMMGVGLLARRWLDVSGWIGFFVGVAVYTCIYALLMFKFVMNEYEQGIVMQPIRKFLARSKNKG